MPKARKDRAGDPAVTSDQRNFWDGWSVRTQLLIIVGAVNLLAVIIGGTIWILNTRSATRAEIDASLEIAQRFASATIKDLASQDRLDLLSERLPEELRNLRHVRILLMEDGKLTMRAPKAANGEPEPRWAPKWFAALVGPELSGRSIRVVSASRADPVIVIGDTADEIAEAWRDFSSLVVIWITLNTLIIGTLYFVLGRVLDPLATLARGMQRLKGGRYATRIEPSRVTELARITDRFNMLAIALDGEQAENSQLYSDLISTQEKVRREIAHELHDEAGACLFGIAANASSIRTFAERLPGDRTVEIGEHVGEILGNAERLKAMNRAILKQLRPGPIGQVKLEQLINELVSDLQRTHRDVQILAAIEELADSYGEGIDLTLYRCIQEGVTAAVRKGNAKTIYIDVAEQKMPGRRAGKEGRPVLHLVLRFDGAGLPRSKPKDLTLATVAERVRALGGSCAIKSTAVKGTTIRIDIPLKRMPAERDMALT